VIAQRLKKSFLCLCVCILACQARAGEPLPKSRPGEPLLAVPGVERHHTLDLPGILERGTLRVLTTYSRTNYFIMDGKEHGFEHGLVQEYIDWLNERHPDRRVAIMPQFVPMSPDTLIDALIEGRGDIVASHLHITKGCRKGTHFTEPYLTGVKQVLAHHSGEKGLGSLESMSGRNVYVSTVEGCMAPLARKNRTMLERGLEPFAIRQVDPSLTVEDVLQLVSDGVYPMTVADAHIASLWARMFGNIQVREDMVFAEGLEIGLLVRDESSELGRSLNEFLRQHRKGTTLGNIFFNRYVKNTPCIRECLDEPGKMRFAGYADLFKKYGQKYGIDWLLIAAQAYQESRLQPDSVSNKGAFGIMQVMPVLARDRRIGITDLHDVEKNIHAGVKYLHLLLTAYFQDKEIDLENRIRFALAAYNAGPEAIHRARLLADRRGLDSNIWIDNVELAVLDTIGLEPVNYVREINVRYIAYSLSLKALKTRAIRKQRISNGQDTALAE